MSTADTFLLTLGVDDQGSIKVQNFKKQVEGAGDGADDAGKKLEKSSGGFRALGFASAQLGNELGVPFRASHMLGTKVEELSQTKFPAYGAAMGVAGAAALALVGGIVYLVNHKKQLREELEKSVTALSADMDALYSSEQKTKALQKATQELALAKRPELLEKESNLLYETTKAYGKLTQEMEHLKEVQAGVFLDQAESGGFNGLTDNLDKLQRKIAIAGAEIKKQTTTMGLHASDADMGYSESERLGSIAAYNKAVTQIWQQEGLSFKELMEAEKNDFQSLTDAKLASMTNEDQQRDYKAQRDIERAAMVAQKTIDHTKAMEQAEVDLQKTILDGMNAQIARQQSVAQSTGNINQFLPGVIAGFDQLNGSAAAAQEQQMKAFDAESIRREKDFQESGQLEKFQAERSIARDNLVKDTLGKNVNSRIDGLASAANFMNSMYASWSAGSSKNAKDTFDAQKKSSYATAICNTAAGIAKCFGAYGFWEALGYGALIGIAGAAQINAISSTSFDGGGSVAIPSGGFGSTAATSDQTTASNIVASPVTNVYVGGDVLDMDQFSRKMLPSIKKAEMDNVR
jgi:hypothetical protein